VVERLLKTAIVERPDGKNQTLWDVGTYVCRHTGQVCHIQDLVSRAKGARSPRPEFMAFYPMAMTQHDADLYRTVIKEFVVKDPDTGAETLHTYKEKYPDVDATILFGYWRIIDPPHQ